MAAKKPCAVPDLQLSRVSQRIEKPVGSQPGPAMKLLPSPKRMHQPTAAPSRQFVSPATYSPALGDSTNPQIWHDALLAAHHEIQGAPEIRTSYDDAAMDRIWANEVKLMEEKEVISDLRHLTSRVKDFRQMLQTRLKNY